MHTAAIVLAGVIFGPSCVFIGVQSRSWLLGIGSFVFLNLMWLLPAVVK